MVSRSLVALSAASLFSRACMRRSWSRSASFLMSKAWDPRGYAVSCIEVPDKCLEQFLECGGGEKVCVYNCCSAAVRGSGQMVRQVGHLLLAMRCSGMLLTCDHVSMRCLYLGRAGSGLSRALELPPADRSFLGLRHAWPVRNRYFAIPSITIFAAGSSIPSARLVASSARLRQWSGSVSRLISRNYNRPPAHTSSRGCYGF